jgi:hypothetical protein
MQQLIGKWRAAAAEYRRKYPSQTIPSKICITGSMHTRTSTRTLPLRYAVPLLQRILIPWAVELIRASADSNREHVTDYSYVTDNSSAAISAGGNAQQQAATSLDDNSVTARQMQLDSLLQKQLSCDENVAEEADADIELLQYIWQPAWHALRCTVFASP